MGYIKHHTVIVTGYSQDKIEQAHSKAIEIFANSLTRGRSLISPILLGIANEQYSFFIAPDGSKEGWEPSNNGDEARKLFLNWLRDEPNNYSDYIEIMFGGDDDNDTIVRSKDTDLDNL